MQGRTWKNIESGTVNDIKSYLLSKGGVEDEAKGAYEAWRIRFCDSTFTFYQTGTLTTTPTKSQDPSVLEAWEHINSIVGSAYVLPTKDFLIGLDETGKGELIGHTVLSGVIFPKEIFAQLDLLIGPADTKDRHPFGYWDNIFHKLDNLRSSGLDFVIEKVTPWHVDRFNLNKIMDVSYQRILSILSRKAHINQCRVVLDDYNLGPTLKRFLNVLEMQGTEVVVTTHSEDKYLEAKTASLISKRVREGVVKAINENEEFQIGKLTVGSGNAADSVTLMWLKKWHASSREWPWFVKRSFQTIRKIEGKTGKVSKETPPIKEKLLSQEFLETLGKGKLSIQSLSVVCPHCGAVSRGPTFASFQKGQQKISTLKCSNSACGELLERSGMTLRYYCGYVVPDSSAIQRP